MNMAARMSPRVSTSSAPHLIFTSGGPNPLNRWDVITPRGQHQTQQHLQPEQSAAFETASTLSPRESSSSDRLQARISPVRVQLACGAPALANNKSRVEKVYDEELRCFCFDLLGSGVYVTAPPAAITPGGNAKGRIPKNTLHVTQAWITLLVKYVGEAFQFEFTIKDAQSISRRIRFSTFNIKCKNSQFVTAYPLPTMEDPSVGDLTVLEDSDIVKLGWNVLSLNVAKIVEESFGQQFQEVASVSIHSNCKLKTIVATERFMTADELSTALGSSHWPSGASRCPLVQLPTALKRFPSSGHKTGKAKQKLWSTPNKEVDNAESTDIDNKSA
eukprot:Gregarina_sp_Poly_1__112@NODE_1024_length_5322_cov_102_795433_g714_i0_p2_GENE_NODE_1024_length_5322_cov_102_795433_g714_i0NODE_1024_length_5322_cov_102_795433_g714_i0_p2_ORF_typecomplete_len331_score44_63DUF667/PF05018_13/4_6e28_NODE_1024_length_5322_cov_102_795433_g714_i01993